MKKGRPMKFTLDKAFKFHWPGLIGRAYNSKEDFRNASAAYFKVLKNHGKVKSKLSDRVYYVLNGKGTFVINGKAISVKKTDVVIIPKNTPYDYKGKMELFLVHIPAFNAKYEVKLS